MKGYSYYKRAFLNKPGRESVGYILANLSENGRWAELHIGDCFRHITLSVNASDRAERQNTIFKLNMLIDTLVELRNKIVSFDRPKK